MLVEALDEIAALPPGCWERRAGQAMMDFAQRRRPDEWSDEMLKLSERIKAYEKKLKEQGRAEDLASVLEARLGRALTPAERATLRAKVSAQGPARVARRVASLVAHREPGALGAWLAGD